MIKENLDLIWQLAKIDFKLRYSSSTLGFFWSLVKPLIQFAVLNFVFITILNIGQNYFSLRILTGLMLFNFFTEGMTLGMSSLMNKAHLISKIKIKKYVFVLSAMLNSLMSFLISLVIMAVFFISYGIYPSLLGIAGFFVFVALLVVFILAFSFFTAPLYLKYRDLGHALELILLLLFWATPIIYPLSSVPENLRNFIFANPLTPIVHFSQTILIDGIFPQFHVFFIMFLIFGAALLLSLLTFRYTSPKSVEYI